MSWTRYPRYDILAANLFCRLFVIVSLSIRPLCVVSHKDRGVMFLAWCWGVGLGNSASLLTQIWGGGYFWHSVCGIAVMALIGGVGFVGFSLSWGGD